MATGIYSLYSVCLDVFLSHRIVSYRIVSFTFQSLASEADLNGNGDVSNGAEASLLNVVRDALLALQLLPDNASAGKF